MKSILPLTLLALLTLNACGSAPSQITGNGRVSIGADADDGSSSVTVTKTVTPEEVDENGTVTPAKVEWSAGEPGAVKFTFMTRPGSDAVYLTGWRITRYDLNGRVLTDRQSVNKMDVYVPSGWTCPEREELPAYQSCQMFTTDGKIRSDVQPANGLPVQGDSIVLATSLIAEVQRTSADAYSVVDIEFTGVSSNNHPVTVKVADIVSYGLLKTGGQ